MRNIILFFILFILFISCKNENSTIQEDSILKDGIWQGGFQLQEYFVPFYFKMENEQIVEVYNDSEVVELKNNLIENDSITAEFVSFPTFLRYKTLDSDKISGYFHNQDIGKDYRIIFSAHFFGTNLPSMESKSVEENIEGTWEVRFRPNTEREFPAVGKFEQKGSSVRGTFLKRSGDARFLTGKIENQTLFLHSFDGTHPALYKADIKGDSLFGFQITNNETTTEFIGGRNPDFKIENADSLTFLVENNFEIKLKTLDGEDFVFPNSTSIGKLKIIQIMGTWCPNCLDESIFFKEMYEKYNSQGLEIYAVAYEVPETFAEQKERVERFKNNKEIPYPILIGGNAKTGKANDDFAMLNKVSAFPTAIFFDKDNNVVKIQTGFTGPGTGEIYDNYRQEMMKYIESFLAKKD